MKHLRYLALAGLVAFAACDETEEVTAPVVVQPGTVVVTVNGGGAAISPAVTVTLGAAGSTPQTTNASGQATFASVPVGNYVVSISGVPVDFVCPTTTQPVTVASNQTTSIRFDCNLVSTASVSGTVTNSNGTARSGASITITRTLPAPAAAAVTVTTDAAGRYSLTGLRSGTYTVQLPVTAGCTTAANTQTVVVAAGEARSVNFVCTVAVTPPVGDQASAAINSITFTGPFGQISNVPDNEVAGSVTVNLTVDEGDQRVSRVRVLAGTTTVCDQTLTQTSTADAQGATFPISCPWNSMSFNTTTGVPTFLNGAQALKVEVFTVAGGNTTPAATATRNIVLVNVDALYARIASTRSMLSTDAAAGGAGFMWQNGDITLTALPIMFSGLTLQNVTMQLTGGTPASGTNLDTYFGGGFGGGGVGVIRNVDTAAPYTATFLAANSIGDNSCPTGTDCGVGGIEDPQTIFTFATLRSDGQVGPALNAVVLICSDGQVPNPILFPFSAGCANGQPAGAFRLDNSAPVIDQVDRALRDVAQFAYPPRTGAVVCNALVDFPGSTAVGGLVVGAPTDKGTNCNGVTGWLGSNHTMAVTRLMSASVLAGNTSSTQSNAIAPRMGDMGVGLPGTSATPGTAYFQYRAGNGTPASGTTAAQSFGSAITSGSNLAATANNNTYYLNLWGFDAFGVAGATTNQRVRWYNNTAAGTGTSGGNITALIANANARFGINDVTPCFTSDGITCADVWLGELRTTGQIIGTAGQVTSLGAGTVCALPCVGGVRDGSSVVSQVLSIQNSAGGSPAFPIYPLIFRITRRAPSVANVDVTAAGSNAGCFVGFASNSGCGFAGESGSTTNTTGRQSGVFTCYDFLVAIVGPTAAHPGCTAQPAGDAGDWVTRDVMLGTDTNNGRTLGTAATCTVGTAYPNGCGDGYYVIDRKAIDNAFLKSATSSITVINDRNAPIPEGGVSFSTTVTPGGSVVFQTSAQDALELAFADFYQVFVNHAIRRARVQLGTFGNASFDTGPLAVNTGSFDWFANLSNGAGPDIAGTTQNAGNSLFRIFDFGMNVSHTAAVGNPILTTARTAGEAIASTSLSATVNQICWNTGVGTCVSPASTTLVFSVTGPVANPFTRVEFAVARDANNDGIPDTDGAGNTLWHLLGSSSLSVVGTTYTYTRVVSASDLALTANRTRNFAPPGPSNALLVRAFGVRSNGNVVTLSTGVPPQACPTPAAAVDNACFINVPGT